MLYAVQPENESRALGCSPDEIVCSEQDRKEEDEMN